MRDEVPSDPMLPAARLLADGIGGEAMGELLASVLGPGDLACGFAVVQRVVAQQCVRRLRSDFAEGHDVSAVIDGALRTAAESMFGSSGDPEVRREWFELCADVASEQPPAADHAGGPVSRALHTGAMVPDLMAWRGLPLLTVLAGQPVPAWRTVEEFRRNPMGAVR